MTTRIAVVSEPLLSRRYGTSGLSVIRALEALSETRLVVSAKANANGIRRDLQGALAADPSASVLLVGGAGTLPFFEIPLVPRPDADPAVITDNPYGIPGASTAPGDVALPTRAIGRIPDHPGDTALSFAQRMAALCSPFSPGDGAGTFYVLGAKVWEKTTRSMTARLDTAAAVDLAPPRAPADFGSAAFVDIAARRHLFNLHGSDRDARWFGQDGTRYPPALDPGAIAALASQKKLQGALVISQACYGAFLLFPGGLRKVDESCCLQFLERGAAGFLGSTTIAYGGVTGEMSCSDILAVEFLRAVSAGAPLGAALRKARSALASAVRSPPSGTELKTLLQFVLYGDPHRVWIPAAPFAKAILSGGAGSFAAEDAPEARARLAEYALWSEEAIPAPKAMATAESPGDGWMEIARFTAGPSAASKSAPAAPEPGLAARRQLLRAFRDVGAEVACFREVVTYPDGSTFEAQSTGGRSLATIREEQAGAEAWWRQPAFVIPRPAREKKKPSSGEEPPRAPRRRYAPGRKRSTGGARARGTAGPGGRKRTSAQRRASRKRSKK